MAYELSAISDYLRSHECFLIHVNMSDYLLDYYTHRKDLSAGVTPEQDSKLKDLIAAFAIHLTARTALETHAWTLSIVSERPYSLFVTGNTGEIAEDGIARGFIVGNILTENIRHADVNGFHAQSTINGRTFNSYLPCESSEIHQMVEAYYRRSEQRPLRLRISETDDSALGLAALPGYDPEWFSQIDLKALSQGYQNSEKTQMRNCRFSFNCDCSPEKLLPFFRSLPEETLNDLYGDDSSLTISCPRCGKQFEVGRELLHRGLPD